MSSEKVESNINGGESQTANNSENTLCEHRFTHPAMVMRYLTKCPICKEKL